MNSKEIIALIHLLDDLNPEVFSAVRAQLLLKGVSAIPHLEEAWEQSSAPFLQSRLENIIHQIQFDANASELREWKESGGTDLIKGACHIAKYQYPDLDINLIINMIDTIRQDVWLELNEKLTALEKVKILNHIIFDVHGFKRNSSNYHSPRNSYINDVISSKMGSPVSLGVIYSAVAQMLNLPIFGVDLPQNFILAYKDEYSHVFPEDTDDLGGVLFYINPYNKGAVFGKREIGYFIKQQKLEEQDDYYQPCDNVIVIIRMVDDLIAAYERQNETPKVDELEKLRAILI